MEGRERKEGEGEREGGEEKEKKDKRSENIISFMSTGIFVLFTAIFSTVRILPSSLLVLT